MEIASLNFSKDFFAYLNDQGASEKTVLTYRFAMSAFAKWWIETQEGKLGPGAITSIDLREYQSYLLNIRKSKPAGINLYMKAMKFYLKWAQGAGHISRLPNFPKAVKEQKAPPKALERHEQNRLLREVERRGKLRDVALVRLLMSCGLRVSEAVALQVPDLDIGERHGRLTVRQGKGNKWREVPIPPEARKAIREWLLERDAKYPSSPWLFPNRSGGHITARCVEQLVGNLSCFSGLDVHPHVLRHTAATNMLRAGADLVTVAQVLGHASLTTTAVYTKPDSRTMAEAVERGEI